MGTMTPMGPGAKFTVNIESEEIVYQDGNGNIVELWDYLPVHKIDAIMWLVESAAQFHNIPIERIDRD